MMRATITAIAVLAVLALVQPGFAQGTSPSVTPKQQQAPVARKQPRPADVNPMPPPRPTTPAQTEDDPDARLNRALNSICRGC
jgi:negative regulator of sigma E activity